MHKTFRTAVAACIVAISGCDGSNEPRTLTNSEINKLLKGNTAVMESSYFAQSSSFQQYFGANGTTVLMVKNKLTGKWRVENNDICFLWDKNQQSSKKTKENEKRDSSKAGIEFCFQIKQASQGKYQVYSGTEGYFGTIEKVIPGNPGKL